MKPERRLTVWKTKVPGHVRSTVEAGGKAYLKATSSRQAINVTLCCYYLEIQWKQEIRDVASVKSHT